MSIQPFQKVNFMSFLSSFEAETGGSFSGEERKAEVVSLQGSRVNGFCLRHKDLSGLPGLPLHKHQPSGDIVPKNKPVGGHIDPCGY